MCLRRELGRSLVKARSRLIEWQYETSQINIHILIIINYCYSNFIVPALGDPEHPRPSPSVCAGVCVSVCDSVRQHVCVCVCYTVFLENDLGVVVHCI